MNGVVSQPPLYDRRRFEALVMEHKLRVHLEQKKAKRRQNAGVKRQVKSF
jgi:hypothetical protein